jgi:putative membrane fusion protein
LEISRQLEVLAIRREQVVFAPGSGRVTLLIKEGQRVPAGTTVVEIRDEAREQDIQPRLSEAREKVRRFDLEAMEALHQIDEAITEVEVKLTGAPKDKRPALQQEKEKLLKEREKQSRANAQQRQELMSQVEEYLTLWQEVVHHVNAPAAGVIRYEMDGLEGILTPQRALELSRSQVGGLSPVRETRRNDEVIKEGAPLFKLIDNYALFLLGYLEPESMDYRAGQRLWFRLPGISGELPGRVEGLGPRGEWQGVLFRIDRYLPAFDMLRQLRAEVITARHQGTILPKRVLRTRGGQVGVYVRTVDGPAFQTVTVLGEKDGLVCVDGLPRGTRVISGGLWLREGIRVPRRE